MISKNVLNTWSAFSAISEEDYNNGDIKYSLFNIHMFKSLNKKLNLPFNEEVLDGTILKEEARGSKKIGRCL